MVARVIAIERLVMIKQIPFCDKTTVDIAILELYSGLTFMLDVRDFLAAHLAKRAMEY